MVDGNKQRGVGVLVGHQSEVTCACTTVLLLNDGHDLQDGKVGSEFEGKPRG